jgi:hypothetical protein
MWVPLQPPAPSYTISHPEPGPPGEVLLELTYKVRRAGSWEAGPGGCQAAAAAGGWAGGAAGDVRCRRAVSAAAAL